MKGIDKDMIEVSREGEEEVEAMNEEKNEIEVMIGEMIEIAIEGIIVIEGKKEETIEMNPEIKKFKLLNIIMFF